MEATTLENSAAGFKSEYFEYLFERESSNFWFRARNKIIVWALRKYFPEARNLLEVGCGTAFVLTGIRKNFPSLQLAGSEFFAEGLAFAQSRLKEVDFFQLDAREIPFVDEFSVIGAFDVIEHIEEDELVLAQFYKACKTGIILTVPQHMFLWSALDEHALHKRRYSANELKQKLERAGFKCVRMTSFVSLLLPALYFSRRKQQDMETFDKSAEFELPRFVHKALECVLDLERFIIQLGLSWPMGGSLLVVARK